jgi:hypothetical protein
MDGEERFDVICFIGVLVGIGLFITSATFPEFNPAIGAWVLGLSALIWVVGKLALNSLVFPIIAIPLALAVLVGAMLHFIFGVI